MHVDLAHIPKNQSLSQTKQLHLISFQVGITPAKQISLPELYLVSSIWDKNIFMGGGGNNLDSISRMFIMKRDSWNAIILTWGELKLIGVRQHTDMLI